MSGVVMSVQAWFDIYNFIRINYISSDNLNEINSFIPDAFTGNILAEKIVDILSIFYKK